jgi:uncharacterized protein
VIRFHLAGLLASPVGTSREFPFRVSPSEAGDAAVRLAGDLTGSVRIQRTNRGVWLEGGAEGVATRSCVRCLDAFDETVRLDLAEEFLPTVELGSGAAVSHVAADDEVRRIDANHEIDLWPVLLEELTLAEPLHPLCRPDCHGLCPTCGRHRDRDPCDCREVDVDPRLAVLADWQPPLAGDVPD